MATQEQKSAFLEDFMARNGNKLDPQAALDEIQAAGPSHPLYSEFEWDDTKAANNFRLQQMRAVISRVRIKPVALSEAAQVIEVPLATSPLHTRQLGGGYRPADPSDPMWLREFTEEALRSLEAWQRRYAVVLQATQQTSNASALAVALNNAAQAPIAPQDSSDAPLAS